MKRTLIGTINSLPWVIGNLKSVNFQLEYTHGRRVHRVAVFQCYPKGLCALILNDTRVTDRWGEFDCRYDNSVQAEGIIHVELVDEKPRQLPGAG